MAAPRCVSVFFLLVFGVHCSHAETATPRTYDLAMGKSVFSEKCLACHAKGITGAPRVGDRESWEQRTAQGVGVLIEHATNGYKGARGSMPPKGGFSELSDAEVAAAVAFAYDRNTQLRAPEMGTSRSCGSTEAQVACRPDQARKLIRLEMFWTLFGKR